MAASVVVAATVVVVVVGGASLVVVGGALVVGAAVGAGGWDVPVIVSGGAVGSGTFGAFDVHAARAIAAMRITRCFTLSPFSRILAPPEAANHRVRPRSSADIHDVGVVDRSAGGAAWGIWPACREGADSDRCRAPEVVSLAGPRQVPESGMNVASAYAKYSSAESVP